MDGERENDENHKKKLRVSFFSPFFPFFFVWLIITGEKERDFLLVEQLCATTNRFGID